MHSVILRSFVPTDLAVLGILARAINRNAIHSGSVAEIVNGSLVTRRSCFETIDPDLADVLKL